MLSEPEHMVVIWCWCHLYNWVKTIWKNHYGVACASPCLLGLHARKLDTTITRLLSKAIESYVCVQNFADCPRYCMFVTTDELQLFSIQEWEIQVSKFSSSGDRISWIMNSCGNIACVVLKGHGMIFPTLILWHDISYFDSLQYSTESYRRRDGKWNSCKETDKYKCGGLHRTLLISLLFQSCIIWMLLFLDSAE